MLDIVVPCVGTGKANTQDGLDITEWKHMMNANLYGGVSLIHDCISLLNKSSQPCIVLVSSVVALSRAEAPCAYSASKNAILSLNSYMAGEYGKMGIRVNCVVPGNIKFPNGRWEYLEKENPEKVKKYIEEMVPMNRFGAPEEVANAIVFLASSGASYTNGAVLTVDGGQNRSI